MRQLDFFEAEPLLEKYGIKFAKFGVAKRKSEAPAIAERLGYPVVLKIISPDIIHKTERRAVKAGLTCAAEVEEAYDEIMSNAAGAAFEGMLVQRQAHGREIIIGGKTDAQFGPVVVFGLGGIFVEIIRDVAVRVAPVTKHDALEMMKEVRGYSILAGARGERPVALDRIADNIVAVSRMLAGEPRIRELDLNPIFASHSDCVAVDVRMMVE
jgi:acetyl-CoA synthetase (ADP-forming)